MMDREFRPPTSEDEDAMGSTSDDKIEKHMVDFEKEEKYKKLYNEEKERKRELQLEMTEQLKEKDSEILRLRKRIQDIPLDWDYKLRFLEKCVAEKEADVELLNQKLRVCVKEKEEEIEMLEEKLRNTEDKLSAAEENCGLAAKELEAYKEIHAQLTADIEKTKTDNHFLKSKVSHMERDFQQRTAIMKVELEQTQQDLRGVLQEKEIAEMQKSQLQERLETASMNSSLTEFSINNSMSAMKLALSQLKERLEKKEKQARTLEKAIVLREKEFARCENDLKREIEDLKEKICLCGEEYKALLIEKTKSQRKLKEVTEKIRPPTSEDEDAMGSTSDDKIEKHMVDFEKEEKYKKLYDEEKKCVIVKEDDIELLNQKPRDSVKEKEALKASASSTSKVAAASSGSSDPSGTDYPNITYIDDVTDSMDLLKLATSDYVVPSAPPVHEDRYLDTPGEPMKLCPVCNKSFPMDVADQDFENHVMDHVEGICPICRMSQGENMTDDDFMRHVNKHYEDSDEN